MKARTVLLAATAFAGFIAARRLFAPTRMPYQGLFRDELTGRRGEAEAARIIAGAQTRYADFRSQQPHVAKLALRIHLERGLLPGLAVYQALLAEGEDRRVALQEMERLMASIAGRMRPPFAALRVFPDPFAVFRRIEPLVVRFGFPSEGWEMTPVENTETCVAFNVSRCFYLDTLTSYGAPELTAVFCGGDDVLFEVLAPAVTWERTETLGRGHEQCNFRWRRAASGRTTGSAGSR